MCKRTIFIRPFILTKYNFTNQFTLLSAWSYLFLFFYTLGVIPRSQNHVCLYHHANYPTFTLYFSTCFPFGHRSWFVCETKIDDLGLHNHDRVWPMFPTSCTTIPDRWRDLLRTTNTISITITITTWSWSTFPILS